jgi:membrane fusion protein (multidrug efflux system)
MNENPTSASPPSAPNSDGKTSFNWSSPLFVWPAALALAVLLFFGLDYFITALTHESTDDAFIAAHVVSIAPSVGGTVVAVHALDNEMVRSNELLVEIDPSSYAITVAQKETSAEAQSASYKAFLAGYDLMRTKVTTAEATVRQSQADADAVEATAKWAQMDFDRAQDLRKQNTVSQRELDAAQTANLKAQADLNAARQKVAVDASKVDEAKATVTATEAAITMALAQWQVAQTNVAAAQIELSDTKVFAPCDGRVTRKAVETGNYVQVGQQLMSIVPPEIWVIANFKESQLKKMKPGQPVRVAIDALGGREFRAHVDSVQAGSGAQFSLLPPENATGNFVKVVQRVPVKILFDEPLPADHTIGPGLSVTPSVQTGSFRVPDFLIALIAIILAFATAFTFRLVTTPKQFQSAFMPKTK